MATDDPSEKEDRAEGNPRACPRHRRAEARIRVCRRERRNGPVDLRPCGDDREGAAGWRRDLTSSSDRPTKANVPPGGRSQGDWSESVIVSTLLPDRMFWAFARHRAA